jgi:2-dehydropantoate 2-reductase
MTYQHQHKLQDTIFITGVGAIGGLITGLFCKTSQAVKLILKDDEQLSLYQHTGLTLQINDHLETYSPSACSFEAVDTIINQLIICCKSYDIKATIDNLKPYLSPDCIIIMIHNGLGVIDELLPAHPNLRFILGLTTLGAYKSKPFTIHGFTNGDLKLGPLSGTYSENERTSLITSFQQAGIKTQWHDPITPYAYEKFAINCSINLLTAIHSCKNGLLLKQLPRLESLITEITSVLCAHGIKIQQDDLLKTVIQVLNQTADNYSSMFKDIQHQKQTEIAYLNKYLVKLAKVRNIPTPINDELIRQFYLKTNPVVQ